MESIQEQLKKFHVSDKTGFLMKDPLETLPDYFEPWNVTVKAMPNLVSEKKMRDTVNKMCQLDHTRLSSYREYRLAHLQLSIIAAGYVWQEGVHGAAKVLPRCISIPWTGVSHYLGIQPIICHASLALANWRWSHRENRIKCLYPLPGGDEADWFLSVTCQVEMDFASALPHILMALDNAEEEYIDELIDNLNSLTDTLYRMKTSLSTMHDRLTAKTFYDILRPFLAGWGGDSPLPEGLIYEGVSKHPSKMDGGSAAQSSTLPSIDALLGVTHKTYTKNFLKAMRCYMPPSHRLFIEWIEERSTVKQFVIEQSNKTLSAAYDACVQSVIDFRSCHIQIVTKYIVMMGNRDKPDTTIQKDPLATKGTGGSDLLPFLKTLRSSTSNCVTSKDDEGEWHCVSK